MVLRGMETFQAMHCSPDHDHDHGHEQHIVDYAIIISLSALTVLLSAWFIVKEVLEFTRATFEEKQEKRKHFGLLLAFFTFTIICSGLRVPVLTSLCAESESDSTWSMWLYVLYSTLYQLQWALMVIVLIIRLISIRKGLRKEMPMNEIFFVIVTVCSLSISLISWIANCVRLLTNSLALDKMNWWLGALSICSLVACCLFLSLSLSRALYKFHIKLSYANFLSREPEETVDVIETATKLVIGTTLSTLSSMLMLICVFIIGYLSHGTNGDLVFLLFIGHSVDVAGNSLALFLSLSIGAAQYDVLCRPVSASISKLCFVCVRRNHLRRECEDALHTISPRPSVGADAPDFVAAAATSKHRLASERVMSENLSHLAMYWRLEATSPTMAATTEVPEAEAPAIELPTMITNIESTAKMAAGTVLEIEI